MLKLVPAAPPSAARNATWGGPDRLKRRHSSLRRGRPSRHTVMSCQRPVSRRKEESPGSSGCPLTGAAGRWNSESPHHPAPVRPERGGLRNGDPTGHQTSNDRAGRVHCPCLWPGFGTLVGGRSRKRRQELGECGLLMAFRHSWPPHSESDPGPRMDRSGGLARGKGHQPGPYQQTSVLENSLMAGFPESSSSSRMWC